MAVLRNLLITQELAPVEPVLALLRQEFENVWYYPLPLPNKNKTEPEVHPTAEHYAEADVLLTFAIPTSLTSIAQTPKLKLLQFLSAGTNHLYPTAFYKSLGEAPLTIASASGIHVSSISEHVIATTLALYHKIQTAIVRLHNEQTWVPHYEFGSNFIVEFDSLTVGILGYGHIGRESARLAKALGAKIIAATRSGKQVPADGYLIPGTGDADGSIPDKYYSTEDKASFHEFLANADVIVNTLPSIPGTINIIGADELRAIRNDGVLVNIGRGDTIEPEALLQALQAGVEAYKGLVPGGPNGKLQIGAASLDVTNPEPLPDGHPFYRLPNLILTPHISGLSRKYFFRAADLLLQQKKRVDQGLGALNAIRGKGERD